MHDKLTLLTEFQKNEEKQKSQLIYRNLLEIKEKPPKEAHEIIVRILYNQQERIQKLIEHNRELWLQIQTYKNNQQETTQDIMREIWDNEEDEFWDSL